MMRARAPSRSIIFNLSIGVVHHKTDSDVKVLHDFGELGLVGAINLLRKGQPDDTTATSGRILEFD
jgi:hypothetical protein